MSLWNLSAALAGGLGLFLLGMMMMTDGLKLAAGPALHRILASATRTRWHALGSGALVTAVVQSSSAVTVAVIGFVNAGLIALGPALWVLFGANVGTTMTSWIVALVGLKFKIEALALPLVGAGVLLRIVGEGRRRGAIGNAVAGFGLLFLGISMLQSSFSGLAGQISLPEGEGLIVVIGQLLVGVLMTVVMQSSSAAMAIALTAAQGGLIGVQGAAAVVIGANIGTTVTAVIASFGATPNARRAAAAHVAFNVLTGCVALALLPWLLRALGAARDALGLPTDAAALLALFHTSFNLLGIVLMWPMADRLTAWLLQRFRVREEDEAQPRYLDDNVLAVPTLALDALEREVARAGQRTLRMSRAVLGGVDTPALRRDRAVLASLDAAIERFVERMSRSAMSSAASERLARTLRVQRYFETAAEQVELAIPLFPAAGDDPALQALHAAFVERAGALLALCDPEAAPPGRAILDDSIGAMESSYEALKAALLVAGAAGTIRVADMEVTLRRYSAFRRALQQLFKARCQAAPPAQPAAGSPASRADPSSRSDFPGDTADG